MSYKFGWDISLLFIVWVVAFGYMAYIMATAELYLAVVVCIITLFAGALTLLHRPDEEEKSLGLKPITVPA